jgi:signal peptidase I
MSARHSTIEEELTAHGVYYATTEGDSMAPLFRNHESVVCFRPLKGRLSRFDVPLVRREDGHCVMHRIVKVCKDGYITRGDNRRKNDAFVPENEVIAVMDGYYEGENYIPTADRRYRRYVFFWGRPNFIKTCYLLMQGARRRILRRRRSKKQ